MINSDSGINIFVKSTKVVNEETSLLRFGMNIVIEDSSSIPRIVRVELRGKRRCTSLLKELSLRRRSYVVRRNTARTFLDLKAL